MAAKTTVERIVLLAIVCIAIAVRAAWPDRVAIEHFDEGVYASDVWYGLGTNQGYPYRHLYAPPFVPLLAEWTLLFSGVHAAAPLWAGIVAGVLTIPSVWWFGRCWWGPTAGLTAAALAATSDVHALFSRTALTDPWLLLWFMWAVFFLERATRNRRPREIVAAGALTGLAWWTKYNGWLPLAVGAGGIVLSAAVRRSSRFELVRSLIAWCLVAGIALLVWSPVWYGLQPLGGYAAVAANHRRYVVGLTGWPDSLRRNLANLQVLEGWLSLALGPTLVALLAQCGLLWKKAQTDRAEAASCGSTPLALRGAVLCSVVFLAAASIWCGNVIALALMTAGVLVAGLLLPALRSNPSEVAGPGDCRPSHADAFLGVWCAGLLVVTPMYYPYARLTLPWLASTWLGAGWAVAYLCERRTAASARGRRRALVTWLATAVALAALVTGWLVGWARVTRTAVPAWQDRSELARATVRLVDAARGSLSRSKEFVTGRPDLVFDVFGEPAVFFHLQVQRYFAGWPVSVPVGDLGVLAPDRPDSRGLAFLLVGPHAQVDPEFLRQRESLERRSQLVAVERFVPSAVTALDHVDARSIQNIDDRPASELRLYRLSTPPPDAR